MIRTRRLELAEGDLSFFSDLLGVVNAIEERAPSIEAELNPIEVLEGLDELECHLVVTSLAEVLVQEGSS